jgi:sec-independent protein translocase protein TatA
MLPNVGAQELLIIFFIALIVVGPRRLPELGRALGRGLNEFKKIQDEVRDMVKFDLSEEPAASTPHLSIPTELDAGSEPIVGDADQGLEPESGHDEMTHSERVVALAAEELVVEEQAAAEPTSDTPAPEAAETGSESSPWIYDVMDDDEPAVENPPAGSAE